MTSRPPASSPAAPPPTLIAAYTPIARLRGGPGGNVVTMRASAAGATIAPPAPCTTRAASSHAWEVANPPAREAAENSSRPVTNIRRRPSRSPARPPSSSSPPNARAYALTTHSRPAPENPRARWICGRATLTMVESSTTINCAVAMTSSARPRWRPPSRALAAARPAPVTDCTCDMAVLSRVRGRDAGVRGTDVVVALERVAGSFMRSMVPTRQRRCRRAPEASSAWSARTQRAAGHCLREPAMGPSGGCAPAGAHRTKDEAVRRPVEQPPRPVRRRSPYERRSFSHYPSSRAAAPIRN